MAQCKAETASGTQCLAEAAPPSRTLCKRHQTMLASGKVVSNFDTGRRFAARAGAARPAPTAARAPRAVRAGAATVEGEEPQAARGLGEHSLMCQGPRCGSMALPGSNYCMRHQGLA